MKYEIEPAAVIEPMNLGEMKSAVPMRRRCERGRAVRLDLTLWERTQQRGERIEGYIYKSIYLFILVPELILLFSKKKKMACLIFKHVIGMISHAWF